MSPRAICHVRLAFVFITSKAKFRKKILMVLLSFFSFFSFWRANWVKDVKNKQAADVLLPSAAVEGARTA